MSPITSSALRQVLDYEPETGVFTWKAPSECCRYKKGRQAGFLCQTPSGHSYRRIGIAGHVYMASHLAWLWTYRNLPKGKVLHGSKGSEDDSIANLSLRQVATT
jgi:hypothetical protein